MRSPFLIWTAWFMRFGLAQTVLPSDVVAVGLFKALREHGVANRDPHLSKDTISVSPDQVLKTEIKAK
jgi:hypothetical protein